MKREKTTFTEKQLTAEMLSNGDFFIILIETWKLYSRQLYHYNLPSE